MSADTLHHPPKIVIRPATVADAAFLVPLIDAAGEGLPSHLWAGMAAPGQNPAEVGLARVRGDHAQISWRNAHVAQLDGAAAGCLFTYLQPDRPCPIPPDTPPIFVPLLELENAACGTSYVHILATAPALRGRGVGSALLDHADRSPGPQGMSVIVADVNDDARRLYERHGYRVTYRRAMVRNGWQGHGKDWLLMTKA